MARSSILQNPERLSELMKLIGGADSVELKLTVPDKRERSAADSLDMDPLDAEIRQVVFFDTPGLELNRAGLVIRARRRQDGSGDTVVKLRPVVPGDIDDQMRQSGDVTVEVDVMPGGFVCSASMKGVTTSKAVRKVARGQEKVGSLFSKSQKKFFQLYAPDGMKMSDLSLLGPINIFKLKFAPPELGRKMVAELWLFPNGTRTLELSTKSSTGEAFQVAAETRAFLTDKGIDVSGLQETKTKTALKYFAASLSGRGAE